jgi:hypothetical protein
MFWAINWLENPSRFHLNSMNAYLNSHTLAVHRVWDHEDPKTEDLKGLMECHQMECQQIADLLMECHQMNHHLMRTCRLMAEWHQVEHHPMGKCHLMATCHHPESLLRATVAAHVGIFHLKVGAFLEVCLALIRPGS